MKAALNKYPWLEEGVDSFDVTQIDETSVRITFNSPRGMLLCTPILYVYIFSPGIGFALLCPDTVIVWCICIYIYIYIDVQASIIK